MSQIAYRLTHGLLDLSTQNAMAIGYYKFVAIFVLVAGFLWRRHGPAKAATSAGLGLALGVLVALPYVTDGMRVGDLLATWGKPSTSFVASLDGIWRWLAGLSITPGREGDVFLDVIRPLFAAGFLLFWGRRTWLAAKRPDYAPQDLLVDGTLSLLVLLCVAQPAFGPWQVGMFLPAALLLPEGHRLRRVALALSLFELLGLTFVAKARILDSLLMTGLPLLLLFRRRRVGSSGATQHPDSRPERV